MDLPRQAPTAGVANHGAPPGILRSNRDFRIFWTGEAISQFGGQITLLALPLTALLVLDANTQDLGILRFFEYLPFLLFGLPFGVLADRTRRRPLLIVANAGRAALVGLVPLLTIAAALNLAVLYATTFGVGALTVLFDVSLIAYLPTLVGPDRLLAANSLVTMSFATAEVSGPGLAGVLVRFLTAPICLALNAVSYLVSVVSLCLIRSGEPAVSASHRSAWDDLGAGLGFLFRTSALRAVAISGAIYNFAWVLCQAAFLVYGESELHINVALIGTILAVGASGGIGGAATAAWLSRRFRFGRMFVIVVVTGTVPSLLIPVVSAASAIQISAFAALFFVMNCALGIYNVFTSTLRQVMTPGRLLGRIAAGYRMLVFGGLALGGIVTAVLGGIIGPRAILVIAGLAFLTSVVPIVLSPIPGLAVIPTAPAPEPPER
ncbi:MAG TPA: MFS transporter [Mycobacteriales bacterium]|nr:MFS transporter [Mycobacteriales bacterium]